MILIIWKYVNFGTVLSILIITIRVRLFTFTPCLSTTCTTWMVSGDWVCFWEIWSFQGIALTILDPATLKLKLIRDIKVCETLDVAHIGSEGFCTKYRSSFKLLMASYSLLNIIDSIDIRKMFSYTTNRRMCVNSMAVLLSVSTMCFRTWCFATCQIYINSCTCRNNGESTT